MEYVNFGKAGVKVSRLAYGLGFRGQSDADEAERVLEKGVELARIPTARKITHGVVLSPDGRYGFVSSEGIGSEKGTLDVFDMRKNKKVTTLELGLQAGGITFWKTVPRGQ